MLPLSVILAGHRRLFCCGGSLATPAGRIAALSYDALGAHDALSCAALAIIPNGEFAVTRSLNGIEI